MAVESVVRRRYIGFTGTRRGMSEHQREQLRKLLGDLFLSGSWFHHGDCIGADIQAHYIARELEFLIAVHPSSAFRQRAYAMGADRSEPAKAPLLRNHDIVDAVDLLIAAPATDQEVLRSGTWATIRYARKRYRTVIILEREPEKKAG